MHTVRWKPAALRLMSAKVRINPQERILLADAQVRRTICIAH